MLIDKHPSAKDNYQNYNQYFNETFFLRFGRPQIDCCCTCEDLKVKLRNPHPNDAAKRVTAAELMVYLRKSMKFFIFYIY